MKNKTKKVLDEFYYHEALDRTHLILEIFTDFVVEHPTITSNMDLHGLAETIGDDLAELYQRIGAKRFEIFPSPITKKVKKKK